MQILKPSDFQTFTETPTLKLVPSKIMARMD